MRLVLRMTFVLAAVLLVGFGRFDWRKEMSSGSVNVNDADERETQTQNGGGSQLQIEKISNVNRTQISKANSNRNGRRSQTQTAETETGGARRASQTGNFVSNASGGGRGRGRGRQNSSQKGKSVPRGGDGNKNLNASGVRASKNGNGGGGRGRQNQNSSGSGRGSATRKSAESGERSQIGLGSQNSVAGTRSDGASGFQVGAPASSEQARRLQSNRSEEDPNGASGSNRTETETDQSGDAASGEAPQEIFYLDERGRLIEATETGQAQRDELEAAWKRKTEARASDAAERTSVVHARFGSTAFVPGSSFGLVVMVRDGMIHVVKASLAEHGRIYSALKALGGGECISLISAKESDTPLILENLREIILDRGARLRTIREQPGLPFFTNETLATACEYFSDPAEFDESDFEGNSDALPFLNVRALVYEIEHKHQRPGSKPIPTLDVSIGVINVMGTDISCRITVGVWEMSRILIPAVGSLVLFSKIDIKHIKSKKRGVIGSRSWSCTLDRTGFVLPIPEPERLREVFELSRSPDLQERLREIECYDAYMKNSNKCVVPTEDLNLVRYPKDPTFTNRCERVVLAKFTGYYDALNNDRFDERVVNGCPHCGSKLSVVLRRPGEPQFFICKMMRHKITDLRTSKKTYSGRYVFRDEAGNERAFYATPMSAPCSLFGLEDSDLDGLSKIEIRMRTLALASLVVDVGFDPSKCFTIWYASASETSSETILRMKYDGTYKRREIENGGLVPHIGRVLVTRENLQRRARTNIRLFEEEHGVMPVNSRGACLARLIESGETRALEFWSHSRNSNAGPVLEEGNEVFVEDVVSAASVNTHANEDANEEEKEGCESISRDLRSQSQSAVQSYVSRRLSANGAELLNDSIVPTRGAPISSESMFGPSNPQNASSMASVTDSLGNFWVDDDVDMEDAPQHESGNSTTLSRSTPKSGKRSASSAGYENPNNTKRTKTKE